MSPAQKFTNKLQPVATNIDVREVGDEQVIDFDIDVNDDYEVQSVAMLNDGGQVVESVVRFGYIPTYQDLGIGVSIISNGWSKLVNEELGEYEAVEADTSHFTRVVPHLRIHREAIEEYGASPVGPTTYVNAIRDLAGEIEHIFLAEYRHVADRVDQVL